MGFVPKAKREEESVGEEKGGKEKRILYINSFIHSTNICEVSVHGQDPGFGCSVEQDTPH